MYVVMGASGHVGHAVADALLAAGQGVIALCRQESAVADLRQHGAEIVTVDVLDVEAMRNAFRRGERAFLLNPPAPVTTDTDKEEHVTLSAITSALDGSNLEKIVLASTYGAQAGDRLGDLSVLYDFEQALKQQSIPAMIQRGAYYMSNWIPLLDAAKTGILPTMFPTDLKLPMVAPVDLGRAAARHLQEPLLEHDLRYVEGPARYSVEDVARAFSVALGKPVEVEVTPREKWTESYKALGFSEAAADAFTRMTAAAIADEAVDPGEAERGQTSLTDYIEDIVHGASA